MMSSRFTRPEPRVRRSSARCLLLACALVGAGSLSVHARQTRTVSQGVYTDAQARRGQAIYKERCTACHGDALRGSAAPPLVGPEFLAAWGQQPLSELVDKIQHTMPANDPGTLTRRQAADIVAHILQVGTFPAGQAELSADAAVLKLIAFPAASPQPIAPAAAHAPSFPPAGNLAQVMRGILFPSSNLIFNVQTNDPGAPVKPGAVGAGATTAFSWVDWGAGIYKGWEIVDYAAVALAESAPLMLTPGRRCENGKPVPVERPDWVKFSEELAEAGRAAYKASQSRSQEAVTEVSNQLADACLHCHEIYRDKPGGAAGDPSNKAARCVP